MSASFTGESMGPILFKNLARLGYATTTIKSAEVARLIGKRTGKSLTRQRIQQLLNAVNISPETIELLARGLGVKPSELTRP